MVFDENAAAIRYLANSPEWPQAVIAVARLVPLIIKTVEQLKRGDRGPDKLAGAVEMLKAQEPWTVETPELEQARAAMISAQVAYVNALTAAKDAT